MMQKREINISSHEFVIIYMYSEGSKISDGVDSFEERGCILK